MYKVHSITNMMGMCMQRSCMYLDRCTPGSRMFSISKGPRRAA